jgi:5-methylcytosine-specific restriction protein B
LVAAFLKTATDDAWQDSHPAPGKDDFIHKFIDLHRLLSAYGAEFGHRTIFEAVRFAAIYAALGEPDWHDALDLQLMQKVLPKLHGSRRKLEDLLIALAKFCVDLTATLEPRRPDDPFDPLKADETSALLPISLSKVKRMLAALRADQFTSFTG